MWASTNAAPIALAALGITNAGGGQFIVYRSFATNVVEGWTNTPDLYFFSRLTGSNALLSLSQPVPNWISWVAAPTLSADGGTVSFLNWNAGQVPSDRNRAADVFSAAVDSDGDGIPDWWLLKYFGHPSGQVADLSRPQDDPDGDGMSNLEEFLAGTDPGNIASVLRLHVSFVASTNGVVLSWPASSSRSYRVQFKDELNQPSWFDSPGPIAVVAGEGRFGAAADQAQRFYRVVASE